jgi:lantibiotic modifying enzyme
MALSTFILSEYYKDTELRNYTQKAIDLGMKSINNGNKIHTFCSGIAGLFWAISFMSKNGLYEKEDITFLHNLDHYLYKRMINDLTHGYFDFLHGATGVCLYFMHDLTKQRIEYIAEYIDIIEEISHHSNDQYRWESTIDFNSGKKGFSLGLSHGISSIISVLCKAIILGVNISKAKRMLNGSIAFLLDNIQDPYKNGSFFPIAICDKNSFYKKSRMAWCNGDLGIGISLFRAAKVLGDNSLNMLSEEILEFSTQRKDEKMELVFDAGICHGSVGIANIYNRMYFNTRKEIYRNSRDFWIDQTIKNAKFENGLAGYKAYYGSGIDGLKNNYFFLEGIAGIAMSLVFSIIEVEPKWDECLLIS